MKILVIGKGAREHALCWRLARERDVERVVCAPGNPGVASVAQCTPADLGNPRQLLQIAESEQIDVTVVGPEFPLSRGIVDVFSAAGRPIVGPTQAAAALESSKVFAKNFMARHRVPTAAFRVCDSASDALAMVQRGQFGYPLVIKADGLAEGKGVVIADDRTGAEAAIRSMMVDRRFGDAGNRVVLEEFLRGHEASFFALADGTDFVTLGSAQDHKRIFDNDQGPNTGGMGAFSPSPLITSEIDRRVCDEIVRPVLDGMTHEGHPYRGFLYVGLMLTDDGPKVVEFNVRFGDPEAQVVLPMLDEDLSWLLGETATGALPSRPARFRQEPHVGVVLAAGGYPGAPETGRKISGIEEAALVPGALVFHAGTSKQDAELVTNGGRVLTVVGRGPTFERAIETAYHAASHIHFDGMQFRHDIGRKALEADHGTKQIGA
ncbi:MAG TPA: phosphoribosylamine--glycine ligase [Vicinamibacterales bacterium]|nr:phosphoribosylamine--glycine ligase [Vicinamibacterales bacterium]